MIQIATVASFQVKQSDFQKYEVARRLYVKMCEKKQKSVFKEKRYSFNTFREILVEFCFLYYKTNIRVMYKFHVRDT